MIARWMMWQEQLMSPYIKEGHKAKTAQAFCRFPWEETEEEEMKRKAEQYKVTPQEEAELNRIIAQWEASKASPQTEKENEQNR